LCFFRRSTFDFVFGIALFLVSVVNYSIFRSFFDVFCLSLLCEFLFEADLDLGFEMVDEIEVFCFVDELLDRSLRIFVGFAKHEFDVAFVLVQFGVLCTCEGLVLLLERRFVVWNAFDRFFCAWSSRSDGGDRLPSCGDGAPGCVVGGVGRSCPVPRRRVGRLSALSADRA